MRKLNSGKNKSKISLAVRLESNSMLSACLDKGFCSRSHNVQQNGRSLIPIFRRLFAALYAGDYIYKIYTVLHTRVHLWNPNGNFQNHEKRFRIVKYFLIFAVLFSMFYSFFTILIQNSQILIFLI